MKEAKTASASNVRRGGDATVTVAPARRASSFAPHSIGTPSDRHTMAISGCLQICKRGEGGVSFQVERRNPKDMYARTRGEDAEGEIRSAMLHGRTDGSRVRTYAAVNHAGAPCI